MKDSDFRQSDHDKYDDKARSAGKALLSSLSSKYKIYDNPDKYGTDLIAECDGNKIYIEVEHKKFDNFRIISEQGIHIAGRKEKFYKDPNKATYHITFFGDFDKAVMFSDGYLSNCEIVSKDCTRGTTRYKNSKFIEAHLSGGSFLVKPKNKWHYAILDTDGEHYYTAITEAEVPHYLDCAVFVMCDSKKEMDPIPVRLDKYANNVYHLDDGSIVPKIYKRKFF